MGVEETHDFIGESMGHALHAIHGLLPDEVSKNFYLNNTDAERVEFLLKEPALHQVFKIEPNFAGKSHEKAAEFKEKGNQLFQKKSYLNATEYYTRAIMSAPHQENDFVASGVQNGASTDAAETTPSREGNDTAAAKPEDSSQLALAFANRSAALFHRKKFQLALQDMSLAFEHGYPEALHYKLHDRRGKCHAALRDKQNAINAFKQAELALEQAKLDEKGTKTWKMSIQKQLQQCELLKEQDAAAPAGDDAQQPAEQAVKAAHSTFPCLVQDVDVHFKTERHYGRHIVSNHDVRVGDVVAAERPFVLVCLPESYETHCYHCLTRTLAPIPCTKTSSVVFCSKKCRSEAWDAYHRFEWQHLNWLGLDWCGRIGHVVVRTAVTQGHQALKEFLSQFPTQDAPADGSARGLSADGVYESGSLRAVWSLCTNEEVRLPEGLREFTCFAIFLLKILQANGFFPVESGVTQDMQEGAELGTVGGALLHLLQLVQCNMQRITYVQNPTEFEDLKVATIGMGIYPTVSLLNHNCDPNAVLVFHGNQAVVKATRDISKKEEVVIDYGWYFYKHGYNERRGNLGFRYSFDCKCRACREKWPLHKNLEAVWPQFKCSTCGRELTHSKALDSASVRCVRCDQTQDIQEGIRLLQTSHDVFAESMQEAIGGASERALPGLTAHLSLMQRLLLQPWRDLAAAQAAVRHCYLLQGNVRLLA